MKILEILYRLVFNNRVQEGLIFEIFDATMSGDTAVIPEASKLVPMLLLVLFWVIASYLIGSINFSLVISKLAFHDDIRKYGSKNAGSTNMNRVYGSKVAILTLIGDAAKGLITVLVGRVFLGDNAAHLCGFFCMLGHCFPIYYRFKGGKGVATAGAVVLAMDPLAGIIILSIFAVITLGMHYVSLGSIMGGLCYPLVQNGLSQVFLKQSPTALLSISSVAMATLLVARHHSNIKRLLSGTESKFYLKKKTKEEPAPAVVSERRSLHHIDDDQDEE